MNNHLSQKLTKSDFLLFLEAPRHLWAKKFNAMDDTLSDFDRHLIDDGYVAEGLAREYLESVLLPEHPEWELIWQRKYTEDAFEARVDALIYDPNHQSYDLYEIKSATKSDKEHLYDIGFQAFLLQHQIKINRVHLLHLNKEYVRQGALDLSRLFICEDLTEKINKLFPEIAQLRSDALRAIQATDPGALDHCLNPKSCPCPGVCHPDLPDFSIYDVPYLSQKKKLELLANGIKNARDIPVTAGLNEKQALVVERARTNTEFIDRDSLKSELQSFQYPLWFLDYETCISAIPKFNGYHPQQQIVFQYSLHKLTTPDADLQHAGYIAWTDDDPALSLLEHLSNDLGNSGTVIVWNKTFEMTMNKGMAQLHPEYSAFLENLNSRIYDLGEIVNKGIYLHPGFKGSWSIKNILPVMVPDLSYEGMAICKGDQASMAWWAITFGHLEEEEKQTLIKCLEHYCALDTLAMVRIFQKLMGMTQVVDR